MKAFERKFEEPPKILAKKYFIRLCWNENFDGTPISSPVLNSCCQKSNATFYSICGKAFTPSL
jgi:hypothetical protein